MVNILLGLCSMPRMKHVVELTSSTFFQYSYSSVTKVLTRWRCSRERLLVFVLQWIGKQNALSNGKKFHAFIHDYTKLSKPHSECLRNRSYHVTNNPIGGRRQLSGGYDFSCLSYDCGQSGHCPIVDCVRLDGDENQLSLAREQLELVMKYLGATSELILVKADSNYGRVVFLHTAYQYDNMLIISRLQSGINVYKPYEGAQKRGRKKVFGQGYILRAENTEKTWYEPKTGRRGVRHQTCIHELPIDEQVEYETKLGSQTVKLIVQRWNGLLLRSKRGFNMEQSPLDVLSIQILDIASEKEIYKRPMYLAVAGKQRSEIPTQDVALQYKGRYQIEPHFRFIKYDLLLDKLQTPKVEHLDVWTKVIQLCTWFLYLTAQEVEVCLYEKWQRHLKKQKNPEEILTPSEVRKTAADNIRDYDLSPFAPRPFKIGTGREAGTVMKPREKHRIRKKVEIRAEKLAKTG